MVPGVAHGAHWDWPDVEGTGFSSSIMEEAESPWSCLYPGNVLLGQLDICANFLILNRYSNQIVKAHSFDFTNVFCTVQNTVEISFKVPLHSYHTQPLSFIQSTWRNNLLEVGEQSTSNQERNNYCLNFSFPLRYYRISCHLQKEAAAEMFSKLGNYLRKSFSR